MAISIIVPAYNNAEDLPECILGIKTSALPDTETIVVDDGSTDSTAQIPELMGVRTLTLPVNSGPAAARNYGQNKHGAKFCCMLLATNRFRISNNLYFLLDEPI